MTLMSLPCSYPLLSCGGELQPCGEKLPCWDFIPLPQLSMALKPVWSG